MHIVQETTQVKTADEKLRLRSHASAISEEIRKRLYKSDPVTANTIVKMVVVSTLTAEARGWALQEARDVLDNSLRKYRRQLQTIERRIDELCGNISLIDTAQYQLGKQAE